MITVAGEALIDVLIAPSGEISAFPGGGPFNVARTIARLGHRCQFVGRMGDDAFGRRVRAALDQAHVLVPVPAPTDEPTTLAVAEVDADGVADYRFYLEGTSAAQLSVADIPPGLLAGNQAIAVGGLGLLVEPMSSTLSQLLAQASSSTTVLLDPNCRPHAISDPVALRATIGRFLSRADVVKVSVDDLTLLDPRHDAGCAARRLLETRANAVLVTDGGRPVTVHTAVGERAVPVPGVDVVDTVGAGDAFVAGFLTWWADHGCGPDQTGDLELLVKAAGAAVLVAAAACSTAGANLPDAFDWTAAAVISGG